MNTQSASPVPSRRVGRSILALLTGIALGVVLLWEQILACMPLDWLLRSAPSGPNLCYCWRRAYRSIYGIIGAYVIARLAPDRPMGHALVAGGLGLVVSTLGAAAAWNNTAGQRWYPVALAVTAMPMAWIGGRLRQLQLQAEITPA